MQPKKISVLPTKSILNTRPILDSFPQKMPIIHWCSPFPRFQCIDQEMMQKVLYVYHINLTSNTINKRTKKHWVFTKF